MGGFGLDSDANMSEGRDLEAKLDVFHEIGRVYGVALVDGARDGCLLHTVLGIFSVDLLYAEVVERVH